jgi:hypothetical protein
MWTILCNHKLTDLTAHMATKGTLMTAYHANLSAVYEWCNIVASGYGVDAVKPAIWIRPMLETMPQERWTVHMLSECIGEVDLDSEVSVSFLGSCCREDHEIAESVRASTFQPSELYRQRSLKGPQVHLVPPRKNLAVNMLEVPENDTVTNRDDLSHKIIHWSRAARQPPPLPPRATPVMLARDKERISGDIQEDTASTFSKASSRYRREKKLRIR